MNRWLAVLISWLAITVSGIVSADGGWQWDSGYKGDAPDAIDTKTDTTLFGSKLSATDVDVQKALDTLDDAAATGVSCTDCVALTTETSGNYVSEVADGTGIDGSASSEGATYTPTLDLTEISSTTLGAGSFTTLTFDAGATDPVVTSASDSLRVSTGNFGVGGSSLDAAIYVDGSADEPQVLIQSNATQTTLPFVLEDSGGVDQITMAESGILIVNEEGNTGDPIFRVEGDTLTSIFHIDATNMQVGVGASPNNRFAVSEINTATSGSVIMDNGSLEMESTGTKSATNLAFQRQLQIDTAQTYSGQNVAIRGNAIVNNSIAATLSAGSQSLNGGLFQTDVEDATVTEATGVFFDLPSVDTGTGTRGIGLDIGAASVGTGSMASYFGIRIPPITQAATDNIHIQHSGATPIIRLGSANAALTWQDSAANTLATLTDGGTQGNLAVTGTFTSSLTTALGWTVANAANQACNTTCTAACVVGLDTAALGNFLACTDATADTCLCAG